MRKHVPSDASGYSERYIYIYTKREELPVDSRKRKVYINVT